MTWPEYHQYLKQHPKQHPGSAALHMPIQGPDPQQMQQQQISFYRNLVEHEATVQKKQNRNAYKLLAGMVLLTTTIVIASYAFKK